MEESVYKFEKKQLDCNDSWKEKEERADVCI